MKFKFMVFILIAVIALGFIFNQKNQEEISSPILNRSTQIKAEVNSLSIRQKEAIYFMLAYNYPTPIKTGEVIFNSKIKPDYYKKNKPLFKIDYKLTKFLSKKEDSNVAMRNYIKNNSYLSNNFSSYIEEFITHLNIIKTVPSSYISTNHINMYLFKSVKAITPLVAHNYIENKNVNQIKEYYQTLFDIMVKADGNLISTLLNVANLIGVHKFVDTNKIFATDSFKAKLKEIDNVDTHQKILLNDISETHQLFEKYSASEKKSGSIYFPKFGFLKDINFIGKAYTKTLEFLFSPEYLFNLAYNTVREDIFSCFDNYKSCTKYNDLSYKGPGPLQFSNLYMFTSHMVPNLNKLRIQISRITDN